MMMMMAFQKTKGRIMPDIKTPPSRRKDAGMASRFCPMYESHWAGSRSTNWTRMPNGVALLLCYGEVIAQHCNKTKTYTLVTSVAGSYRSPDSHIPSWKIYRYRTCLPMDIICLGGVYYMHWHRNGESNTFPLFYGLKFKAWDGPLNPKHLPSKFDAGVKKAREQARARSRLLARLSYGNRAANKRFAEVKAGTRPPEKFNKQDIFRMQNAQLRAQAIELFGGVSKVFGDFPRELVHTEKLNGSEYRIVDIQIRTPKDMSTDPRVTSSRWQFVSERQPGNRDALTHGLWGRYLLMINPSTGEEHLEGIPNDCQTPKQALAWRDHDGADASSYITPSAIT